MGVLVTSEVSGEVGQNNVILENKRGNDASWKILTFTPLVKKMQADLVWEYNLRKCYVNKHSTQHIYIYIYTRVCVCVYVHILCLYIYIYIYIYTHIHT